jgi:hypothetical protein
VRGRKKGEGKRAKGRKTICFSVSFFGGSDVDVLDVRRRQSQSRGRVESTHSGIAETRLLILHEVDSKLHNGEARQKRKGKRELLRLFARLRKKARKKSFPRQFHQFPSIQRNTKQLTRNASPFRGGRGSVTVIKVYGTKSEPNALINRLKL